MDFSKFLNFSNISSWWSYTLLMNLVFTEKDFNGYRRFIVAYVYMTIKRKKNLATIARIHKLSKDVMFCGVPSALLAGAAWKCKYNIAGFTKRVIGFVLKFFWIPRQKKKL